MTTTFIYGLVDPRDNQVRYVGKANNPGERLKQHLTDTTNPQKKDWIQELDSLSIAPAIVVLDEVVDGTWLEREQYWIAKKKDEGCCLLNSAPGGAGERTGGSFTLRPMKWRIIFAKKGWLTNREIANGLKLHVNTISRALTGKSIDAATVRRVAEAIGKEPLEIAEFVVED